MGADYTKFKGIFPALLTPFGADGKPDYEALGQLIRYTLKKGVAGYYVGGSTGEVFLLTPEERRGVYEACAKEAKGKATLIGHVGDLSTQSAVEYAKLCDSLGYDAISSCVPFYYKYSAAQIVEYYKTLAAAVSIPVLLYHIPILSGVSFGMDVFDQLLTDDRFLGVKYTSNDYFLFERLRTRYPDKIFYNGFDEMFVCGMAMGADGAIGSTYNLMGEKFIDIYNACLNNNFFAAHKMQQEANDIISCMIDAGDVKAALKYAISSCVGIPMGTCRAPGGDASDAWKKAFDEKYGGAFRKA